MTPAQRLAAALPWTYDNLLRIAAAALTDPAYGDITPDLVQVFLAYGELTPGQVDALGAELDRMRRAHFAALGQPLPSAPA